MKIQKYHEFKGYLIKEADEDEFALGVDDKEDKEDTEDTEEVDGSSDDVFNDSPESYLKGAINKLKRKIEGLFNSENTTSGENMSLLDMNLRLESSDIAKSSRTHKSLMVKFTDDEYYYSLYLKVSLKEAMDLIRGGEEMGDESIQKVYVKMKKISLDTYEEMGSVNVNTTIGNIDEEFIVNLKIDLDKQSSSGNDEEFEIEIK